MGLKEAFQNYKKNPNEDILSTAFEADEIQLVVRENAKHPGETIFVREDGKVGFSTKNSLEVKIGDVVRGRVHQDEETYFLFEVQSIVSK